MKAIGFNEVYAVATDKSLAESGGGHNAKGIEFQKHWAILHLFELAVAGKSDFLLLFEAVQDVAVLDSSVNPSTIEIYQLKKKDRGEWTWNTLTSLPQPEDPTKKKKATSPRKTSTTGKPKPPADISDSPIGKLYASVHAFSSLKSSGKFISNAGCDLNLVDGSNAATSLATPLSELPSHQVNALLKELGIFHKNGEPPPDLTRLYVERVSIPVNDPGTHVIGAVHMFLNTRSPRHSNQAQALVEALLIQIGPLGARTDTCKTFDEMRLQHGYDKSDFTKALSDLEEVPDFIAILEIWLAQLLREDMDVFDITSIRLSATSIYRKQVMGVNSQREKEAVEQCDDWLTGKTIPSKLKPFFEEAYENLKNSINMRKSEILAYFALRAIAKCADQI